MKLLLPYPLSPPSSPSEMPLSTGKMYDVKLKRKKLQLQVGGMGLQVFERRKPIETHMYTQMREWSGSAAKGLQIVPKKGDAVWYETSDFKEIFVSRWGIRRPILRRL
eukprot:SAG31_NODE_21187_length_555_cov_4.699561_1_plen_108_part_00